jgi:hypothetical protein
MKRRQHEVFADCEAAQIRAKSQAFQPMAA